MFLKYLALIALIAVSLLITNSTSQFQTGRCREPDPNELLRILKSPDPETLPPSFMMLPHFRKLSTTHLPSNRSVNVLFRGETSCKKMTANICPSYHVVQYDPERVPSTIIQAECACKHCKSSRSFKRYGNGMKFNCEKIISYSRVLRKTECKLNIDTNDLVMQYKKVWEPVSVACTCVLK
ncbi:hypothetical protein LOTGIDRAFT_164174 [Lottia gigantea]|uniref:CTCK domain-containing protein n=1 Tax=Lottia gigantea TaxID=225164 RepID=V4AAB6_LOTGI|nr:hypothetical protein LOTGIDRAFT_164174 [Lottia gigantea]ESO90251.1 hypothetical protein LOTGIDRAFT_164174 [Lottia gigantea]